MLNNFYQRYVRMNAGQNPVNASDVSDDLACTPSTNFRVANGTATLVSGAVVVATGLNTITAFIGTVKTATGFTPGATEAAWVTMVSSTTGAATVNGLYANATTGATTVSVSGTAAFTWIAFGT